MRRIAWLTTAAADRASNGRPMDAVLANPYPYASALHDVPDGVGGYRDSGHGKAGKARCGTSVPADDESVWLWLTKSRPCKRCERITTKGEGR